MLNIDRLLKKKGWTGAELGKLELANAALAYKKAVEDNNPETEPAISRADFEKMLSTLKDPTEGRVYNGYISIHNWIANTSQVAIAQDQQAQLQFDKLWSFIENAITAEDLYSYIEELPLIMTEKQYKETVEKRTQEILKSDGEDLQSNIFNLIERATAFYLHKLQTEPEKPNPLKAIRKKYIAQPVKSKLILDRYNEVTGECYYTLEDGRRSDQMTIEEWQDAITRATDETDTIAQQRIIDRFRVIFNGGTEEEADKAQEKADYERGLAVPAEWHTYTEPPTDLTKWDIIEQELLFEFYPASLDGEDPYTESNFNASMEDFKKEFSELVNAMLSDMDKRYFKGDKVQASKLPVKEWATTLISWRRLYELDFYGERAEAESDTSIFNGNKRAIFNGIAIIRASDIGSCRRIDPETGYYTAPDLRKSLLPLSLEAFFTDSEKYSENVERVEQARKLLISSVYFVDGFNKALELIASMYDVEEVKLFTRPTDWLKKRVDALNSSIYMLYMRIKNTDYEEPELREKKLEVLKDIFQPIDLKKLRIPEAKIKLAKQNMKDFKGFKDSSKDPYLQLCIYNPEEAEEELIDLDEEPAPTEEDGEGV